jgi:hypothetical protein
MITPAVLCRLWPTGKYILVILLLFFKSKCKNWIRRFRRVSPKFLANTQITRSFNSEGHVHSIFIGLSTLIICNMIYVRDNEIFYIFSAKSSVVALISYLPITTISKVHKRNLSIFLSYPSMSPKHIPSSALQGVSKKRRPLEINHIVKIWMPFQLHICWTVVREILMGCIY